MSHLTYTEAVVVGLFQGVTELFPVSSLGHSVLIPALVGGQWARDLDVSRPESPYLAYVVGLHVATALALIAYFWRDWVRIVGGLVSSIARREMRTSEQRLAWLVVLATIPVGLVGLLVEHAARTYFGRPVPTAIFLMVNGVVLYAGERLRRGAADREPVPVTAGPGAPSEVLPNDRSVDADGRLARLGRWPAVLIGSAQILALLPGISRSGATMVAGLVRGLSHEDAARFAFLLATPVILAAGVLKIPDLTGPLGNGIHGQVLVGSLLSGIGAYVSVRFLTRYFRTRTLTPFAIYCVVAGALSLAVLVAR